MRLHLCEPPVTLESIAAAKADQQEQQVEGLAHILAAMNDDPPCSRMADQVRAADYRRIAALALSASRRSNSDG